MKSKNLAFVALAFGALFFSGHGPSQLAQNREIPSSRHPGCGCFTCGSNNPLIPNYILFADRDKDCVGIIAADACSRHLGTIPRESRESFCTQLRTSGKFSSFKDSCPVYASVCESPPTDDEDKPKEGPPAKCRERGPNDAPWFDPSAEGCQNLQDTKVNAKWTPANGGTCSITLAACNYTAFTYNVNLVEQKNGKLTPIVIASPSTPRDLATMGVRPIKESECNAQLYDAEFGDHPNKVCCDIWREGVGAGSGCNPERDADCDGLPNDRDQFLNVRPYYAPPRPSSVDSQFFQGNAADFDPANFDSRPPGLNWDELMPNEPCKRCKWVALSGKLTCSPDGRTEHEYKATWLCPTTGIQRVVTKRAPASAPCTQPRG